MSAVTKPDLIRSECGRYLTERSVAINEWRAIYAADGTLLGKTTYWSSRYTDSRIGFECGFGKLSVNFSYPRYPKWFRRRWVLCFDLSIEDLSALVERLGCKVIVGFKVGMTVWSSIGFRATSKQLRAVDAELNRLGVKWNGPPARGGQWEIECPRNAKSKGAMETEAS